MKIWEAVLIIVIVFLVATAINAVVDRISAIEAENKMLKKQNQMLENTIENFGAEIEELSNTIGRLMKENRAVEKMPNFRR